MRYAQISSENVVVAVSELAGLVEAPHMIPIGGEPPVLGSIWDGDIFTPPPAPDPVPLSLTHLQFIEHAQAVGGITDTELVAAEKDANLAAFWIKFRLATAIDRDNPTIGVGLNALVALNYLTAAERAAVIDHWPVQ